MPVTIDTSLPLHDDREASWDGDAATAAMAAACGGRGESLDVNCMSQGFLWRDPDADPTTLGAYKFPVANVFGGRKEVVWSAISTAASYLDRAVDIPAEAIERMRSALETFYERFSEEFDDDSIRAPWVDVEAAGEVRSEETVGAAGTSDSSSGDSAGDDAAVTGNDGGCGMLLFPGIQAAGDGVGWAPLREWFEPAPPSPLTVTPEGRVYGDLARFGQRHIGADGQEVYAPKDPDGRYEAFRQRRITCDDGSSITVGVLTMDTGHAGIGMGSDAAVAHYDNTGAMVAAVAVGEDDLPDGQGRIWFSGALLPTVTDGQRLRLQLSGVSGDWRQRRHGGPLELVAALAVNVPGFPVPAAGVDVENRQLSVVAAGAVLPVVKHDHDVADMADMADISDELVERIALRVSQKQREYEQEAQRRPVDEARVRRAREARVRRAREARDRVVASARLVRARCVQHRVASVKRGGRSWGSGDSCVRGLVAQGGRFLDSRGRNWVERTGGLPEGIRAVADELMFKGYGESHAIAIAVNVVKKWCWGAPDGLNWPGIQNVLPSTRARGCRNVLEWNLNRARAALSTALSSAFRGE